MNRRSFFASIGGGLLAVFGYRPKVQAPKWIPNFGYPWHDVPGRTPAATVAEVMAEHERRCRHAAPPSDDALRYELNGMQRQLRARGVRVEKIIAAYRAELG